MANVTPASRQLFMSSLFLAASVAAIYCMRLSPASFAAADMMGPITESGGYRFPGTKILLRRTYTGNSGLDLALSFFVAAFLPGAAGWNVSFQLLQAYFLFFFFSILAVWSVEAGRSRNAHAAIRLYVSLLNLSCTDSNDRAAQVCGQYHTRRLEGRSLSHYGL